MADYFNKLRHDWVCIHLKKSYRIVVGKNKGLPEGLEKRFPSMLELVPTKAVIKKIAEEPKTEAPTTLPNINPLAFKEPVQIEASSEHQKSEKELKIEKLEEDFNIKVKENEADESKSKRQKTWALKSITKQFEEEKARILNA